VLNRDAVIDLIAELGAHTPAMPRAACQGHRDVFDSETEDGIEEARKICADCVERGPCGRWAASMDPTKLVGVIAGQLYTHKKRRTAS
jgi:hypothetical protein